MKKYLELNDFNLTNLNIEWKNLSPGIEENPYIDYDILRNQENPCEFGMRLIVHTHTISDPKKPSLVINAEILGFFTFFEDATLSENDKQYLIRLNGSTILYGMLRGVITSTSGAFPCGHFVLPSVYMQELIPKIEQRKRELLKQAQEKKPKRRTVSKSKSKIPSKTKKQKSD